MSRFYRTAKTAGLAGTVAWLERWYGSPFDLNITEIAIKCPPYDPDFDYRPATNGRESELHIYLKHAAKHWLEHTERGTASFERHVYAPDEDLAFGHTVVVISPDGERIEIDPMKPYVVPKGGPCWCAKYGDPMRVDVLFEGDSITSIEVGGTTPYKLLTPLLEGPCDRVIWIPFPDVEYLFQIKAMTGYAITMP